MILFFLLLGLVVVDSDLALQKKQEVKALLELANHNATWAVDQVLKTEGVIELVESEAIRRLDQSMEVNGGYQRQGNRLLPNPSSVTTDPLLFAHYYVDFQRWKHNTRLYLRHTGDQLFLENVVIDGTEHPSGGTLQLTMTTESEQVLTLAPKKMVGPSLVAVAFVDEKALVPLLPPHAFPVVSVEELKW